MQKVARGEVEWTVLSEELTQRRKDAKAGGRSAESEPFAPLRLCVSHLPGDRIPASLLAVVRKAMALDAAARYLRVADLQADVLAYQNGFATSAEKAGAWKQLTLLVKRNKAASIGAAAVLLTGTIFGTGAILQGRRAERALVNLKKTAPALRQLADSQATSQHFDSALEKLDAAIALDPDERSAYWRRAWLFIGMDRLTDAADAVRSAQQKDPARGDLAAILPAIEKLAALPPATPWPAESGRELYEYLGKVGASGEVIAIAPKVRLSAKENAKLIRQRLTEWLGKDDDGKERGVVELDSTGLLVKVRLDDLPINTVEPLRGLLINDLSLKRTNVEKLEPLRSLPLTSLTLDQCLKITDLSPLQGLPLESLSLSGCKEVKSLEALQGMHLHVLNVSASKVSNLSALQRMPITALLLSGCGGITTIEALRNMPLEYLLLNGTGVADLSPLRGMPIRELALTDASVADLSPLANMPLVKLHLHGCVNLRDVKALATCPLLSEVDLPAGIDPTPLRGLIKLERISYRVDAQNRPAQTYKEFFPEYDAQVAAEKNAPKK